VEVHLGLYKSGLFACEGDARCSVLVVLRVSDSGGMLLIIPS
jgi:hypothetical protein